MNNNKRRFDNAFLIVILMLGIISVSMAIISNFEVIVFPLILLTTVMIIYLSIIVDNDISQKRQT